MSRLLVACLAVLGSGCQYFQVPPLRPQPEPPAIVEGQPIQLVHHSHRYDSIQDCRGFPPESTEYENCAAKAEKQPNGYNFEWTATYGDAKLTEGQVIVLGDDYAEIRRRYERARRRCSRARIPKLVGVAAAAAAAGAYFYGPDHGLEGSSRNIVVGTGLGLGAALFIVGQVIGSSACEDAATQADRLESEAVGRESTMLVRDYSAIVEAFNAKHHAVAPVIKVDE